MKNIVTNLGFATIGTVLMAKSALAQPATANSPVPQAGNGPTKLENPLGNVDSINDFVLAIINIVLLVAYPVLVLAFIWLGFQFVMAQGNSGKLEKVKTNLWYTLLGAIVIIGAKAISLALSGTIESLL